MRSFWDANDIQSVSHPVTSIKRKNDSKKLFHSYKIVNFVTFKDVKTKERMFPKSYSIVIKSLTLWHLRMWKQKIFRDDFSSSKFPFFLTYKNSQSTTLLSLLFHSFFFFFYISFPMKCSNVFFAEGDNIFLGGIY